MTAAVEMTHPTEETLAAFVDGRLDEQARAGLIVHLASCADCRDIVVAATEMRDVAAPDNVIAGRFRGWRIAAAAAAVAAAAIVVFLFVQPFGRAGVEQLVEANDSLQYRRIDGRLTGGFTYKPRRLMRSGDGTIPDVSERKLWQAAGRIQNSEPADFHARGAVQLLLGNSRAAVDALERALQESPDDLQVTVDLAAALIARGGETRNTGDLERALSLAERAWSREPSPEAAWNRAVALERLARDEQAREAWDDYLQLDPSSEWAAEARTRREQL